MDCTDTPNLVDPFIDGELDPGPSVEVAAHLRRCPDCTRIVEQHRALSRAIRSAAPRYAAPERLRSSISAALAAELALADGAPTHAVAAAPDAARIRHAAPAAATRPAIGSHWRPLALAASLVLAVATSSGITAYVT